MELLKTNFPVVCDLPELKIAIMETILFKNENKSLNLYECIPHITVLQHVAFMSNPKVSLLERNNSLPFREYRAQQFVSI